MENEPNLPWACVRGAFFSLDGLHVGCVQVGLGLVSVLVGVAKFAVYLAIWAFGAELVVQSPLAVVTGETATVVVPSLRGHLLSFENLFEV